MTEDIKKKITITKDVTILTKVTCDCCKRELGLFHLTYDADAGYDGFKKDPNWVEYAEWYHIEQYQNYNNRHTIWEGDICPECLPKWITEFRDHERGSSDYMELHFEHMVEVPQILEQS